MARGVCGVLTCPISIDGHRLDKLTIKTSYSSHASNHFWKITMFVGWWPSNHASHVCRGLKPQLGCSTHMSITSVVDLSVVRNPRESAQVNCSVVQFQPLSGNKSHVESGWFWNFDSDVLQDMVPPSDCSGSSTPTRSASNCRFYKAWNFINNLFYFGWSPALTFCSVRVSGISSRGIFIWCIYIYT